MIGHSITSSPTEGDQKGDCDRLEVDDPQEGQLGVD